MLLCSVGVNSIWVWGRAGSRGTIPSCKRWDIEAASLATTPCSRPSVPEWAPLATLPIAGQWPKSTGLCCCYLLSRGLRRRARPTSLSGSKAAAIGVLKAFISRLWAETAPGLLWASWGFSASDAKRVGVSLRSRKGERKNKREVFPWVLGTL